MEKSENRKKLEEIYQKEIRKILPNLPESLEEFEKDLIESFDNPDTFKIDLLKVLLNKIFLSLQFVLNVIRPSTPDSQILSMYLTQTEKAKYFEIYRDITVKVLELAVEGRKASYEEFLKDLYETYMELRRIKEEIINKIKQRYFEEKQNHSTYIV